MIQIGIIREEKSPVDHRVPITPEQAAQIEKDFPGVKIKVQSSSARCYPDDDYRKQGIEIGASVIDCDILMGVKEVPISSLIDDKTYLFFSHTIKKQAYNRNLLCSVLEKNIRLIDYEALINEQGGIISDWQGKSLGLESDGKVIASIEENHHKRTLRYLNQ